MANNLVSEDTDRMEFIAKFCDNGLDDHISRLQKAFDERNWELLSKWAISLKNDCFYVGAIDVCGGIVILQIHLEETPVNDAIIECTLNRIKDYCSRLKIFLQSINHTLITSEQISTLYNNTEDPLDSNKKSNRTCFLL